MNGVGVDFVFPLSRFILLRVGGLEEKWRLKLTSAKVEVEVEAELGKNENDLNMKMT